MFDNLLAEVFRAEVEKGDFAKLRMECQSAIRQYKSQKEKQEEEINRNRFKAIAENEARGLMASLKQQVEAARRFLQSKKESTTQLDAIQAIIIASLTNTQTRSLGFIRNELERLERFMSNIPLLYNQQLRKNTQLTLVNGNNQACRSSADTLKRFINMLNLNLSVVTFEWRKGKLTQPDRQLPERHVRIWEQPNHNQTYSHYGFEWNLLDTNGRYVLQHRYMYDCCRPPGAKKEYVIDQNTQGSDINGIVKACSLLLDIARDSKRPTFQDYEQNLDIFRQRFSQLCRMLDNKDYFCALEMLAEPYIRAEQLDPRTPQ